MSHDGKLVKGPHTVLDLNEKPVPTINRVDGGNANTEPSEAKIQQEIANAASSPANIVPEHFPAEERHTALVGEPPGLSSDQTLNSILNEKSAKND